MLEIDIEQENRCTRTYSLEICVGVGGGVSVVTE